MSALREKLARAMFEANGGKSRSTSLNADQNDWTDDQNMKVYRKLADAVLATLTTEASEGNLPPELPGRCRSGREVAAARRLAMGDAK